MKKTFAICQSILFKTRKQGVRVRVRVNISGRCWSSARLECQILL